MNVEMLTLNDDILKKIENYSKLKLNENEKKVFNEDFSNFLKLVSKLDNIN